MSIHQIALRNRVDEARDQRLQDHYKTLNPHLQAALLHMRAQTRRREPAEPCGGDSAMD